MRYQKTYQWDNHLWKLSLLMNQGHGTVLWLDAGNQLIERAGAVINSKETASLSLRQGHHSGAMNLLVKGKNPGSGG